MKLYDNNPQSKAMQRLIHDTRNTGDSIRFHVRKLQERLKELENADTKSFVHMEYIISNSVEIEKSIDVYYERFSNDFPETEEAPYKPEAINAYNLTLKCFDAKNWNKEMTPTYHLLKRLMENYTLIRKPNHGETHERSVATDDAQSDAADNQTIN